MPALFEANAHRIHTRAHHGVSIIPISGSQLECVRLTNHLRPNVTVAIHPCSDHKGFALQHIASSCRGCRGGYFGWRWLSLNTNRRSCFSGGCRGRAFGRKTDQTQNYDEQDDAHRKRNSYAARESAFQDTTSLRLRRGRGIIHFDARAVPQGEQRCRIGTFTRDESRGRKIKGPPLWAALFDRFWRTNVQVRRFLKEGFTSDPLQLPWAAGTIQQSLLHLRLAHDTHP